MWNATSRQALWASLGQRAWDVVVIGGGITGASVFREAVRAGLSVLLVEQRDFAWGTSSRSTKLVHGGLRYLDGLQFGMVRQAIRERERLLTEGAGLVEPLPFLLSWRPSEGPRRWKARAGVAVYDVLAGRPPRTPHATHEVHARVPSLRDEPGLKGLPYDEARVDDARLVLRLLHEGAARGGHALNYVRVSRLVREGARVTGVELFDTAGQRAATVHARAVVSATGAWADLLRAQVGAPPRVRPLRGSHLVFPATRFPLRHGVSFRHPRDRRFVCAVPWEDTTLLGTTDLDHTAPLDAEPSISSEEVNYLLEAAAHEFPGLGLTREDVVSTYAGVRPVLSSGGEAPSHASREHLVLEEEGLVTVTGGKLTTCRAIAHDALKLLRLRLPRLSALDEEAPFLAPSPSLPETDLAPELRRRLAGRFGAEAHAVLEAAREGELAAVPGTSTLWAELRWAARSEGVVHLDDLLLRRVRLGLVLPRGAEALLPRLRGICQEELGWSDARWQEEARAWAALWTRCYGLPPPDAREDAVHARGGGSP